MKDEDELLGRRDVAALLGAHIDRISHWVNESGLASAVVGWGGPGRRMRFSRRLALRWFGARSCRRNNGHPCLQCRTVIEDCAAVSAHLLEARPRHGYATKPCCQITWAVAQPCAPRLGGAEGGN